MKFCLSMIVKNEAAVIRRCLDSIRPWVQGWALIDTGSTDGTQDIVRDVMRGLPGQIVDREWADFATARNQALDLARSFGADYAIVLDADQVVRGMAQPPFPDFPADVTYVQVTSDGVLHHWREFAIKLDTPCRWYRKIHENIVGNKTHGRIPDGLMVYARNDGCRRRDPQWREKEISLLEQTIAEQPDDDYARLKLAGWYMSLGYADKSAPLIERLLASDDIAVAETTKLWLDGLSA